MYPYGVRGLANDDMYAIAIIGVVLCIYIGLIAIGIAQYVMQAIALNELGKRRRIKNPWLAWIPVVGFSDWIIGSIVDEHEGRNGHNRKWRMVLIAVLVSMLALLMAGYVILIIGIFLMYSTAVVILARILIVVGYIMVIVAAVSSLAYSVCKYICIFKLFESTVPEKAVKYLLLSLLVPLAYPICLMKCRDKGYSCISQELPAQQGFSGQAEQTPFKAENESENDSQQD